MADRSRVKRVARSLVPQVVPGVSRLRRALRDTQEALRRSERARAQEREAAWWNAKRYAYAYRRVIAASLGVPPKELGIAYTTAPPYERSKAASDHIRAIRERAALFDLLTSGVPLEEAVAATVRARLKAADHLSVRSLSQALLGNPTTAVAGHLGAALVAREHFLPELAWAHFQQVPPEIWRRLAPAEYLQTAYTIDPTRAVETVRGLLAEVPGDVPPAGWLAAVTTSIGAGEHRLAVEGFDLVERLAEREPARWADTAADRRWLRPWIDGMRRPPAPVEVPVGHVAFAVLDYKQPDRRKTSSNVGDYIQTLASLGHVVRHQQLRFHGPAELVDLAEELRRRVRPELRLDTGAADVTLVPVHRDASNRQAIPPDTWLLAFGWYMQSVFGRYDFPFHPNLRPIFVSFHCNRPDMLTPEAIEYLRAHGPVGCRDWTTVDLLLSAGVPAFFSGCLTTTTGTVFPDVDPGERPGPDAPMVYVDVPTQDGADHMTQESDEVRDADLVANLRNAIDLLETYRRDYATVVTSRLHCYLPGRSVGATVAFTPKNAADIRFNGLLDLDDDQFNGIRAGLLAKLELVLGAIFAGKGEADVYALWREVCAEDVRLAQARRAGVPPLPPPSFDIQAACRAVRSRQVRIERSVAAAAGEEINVALALDGNLKQEMKVVVEAMVTNSSRPLHLWVLCRDHDADDYRRFAVLFPEVTVTWLPCDEVDYGPVPGMLKHITVSTMDRLLLPDLLPELDRIVYHDLDALPLGDLAELHDWDLAGRPLAARSAAARHVTSGFSNIWRSARRLRDDPDAAHDLIRRMHARHRYDFVAFNAGILVLNLARMRADDFGRQCIPYVERYGMNDQEVLNCYAGADRVVLPPEWNAFPTQTVVSDPKIIHWAGPLKPWKREYVRLREVWDEYAARLRSRELTGATGVTVAA